jgi:hypothetical protein
MWATEMTVISWPASRTRLSPSMTRSRVRPRAELCVSSSTPSTLTQIRVRFDRRNAPTSSSSRSVALVISETIVRSARCVGVQDRRELRVHRDLTPTARPQGNRDAPRPPGSRARARRPCAGAPTPCRDGSTCSAGCTLDRVDHQPQHLQPGTTGTLLGRTRGRRWGRGFGCRSVLHGGLLRGRSVAVCEGWPGTVTSATLST